MPLALEDIEQLYCCKLLGVIFQSNYREMLSLGGSSFGPVSVRLSVRLSQVGVLLKRLNVGSHKQHHTIAQGL